MRIKKYIIALSQKIYLIHLLLYFFYLKRINIKEKHVSNYRISHLILSHIICYFIDSVKLSVCKILNFIRETKLLLISRRLIIKNFPYLKKYYYEIDMPLNISNAKENSYFANKNYFYLKPCILKKTTHSHLFLETYFGVLFRNNCINKASIHGCFDKRSREVLMPYNSIIFKNFCEKLLHQDVEIINISEDKKYLLIHNWFNYYHWFTESIYRFFSISEKTSDFTLILPETLKDIAFVQDSLEALPINEIVYFKNPSVIYFENLYFVTQKKYCDNYDPNILLKIKNAYIEYLEKNKIQSPISNARIFILRRSEYARSIVNIDEMLEVLQKYNIAAIDFEAYSFWEQVAIMRQCKYLIGTHGAGLTNMMFMPEGSSIFELHKEIKTRTDHHSLVYWRLAASLQYRYFVQFCDYLTFKDETNEENRKSNINFELHSFFLKVDVEKFEDNLKVFFNDK